MITAPNPYAQWCACFDTLSKGPPNKEAIDAFRHGNVAWINGVADRFIQSLDSFIKTRLDNAHNQFTRQQCNSRGIEQAIIAAILQLRKEYQYVYELVQVIPIPEKYLKSVIDYLRQQGRQTQENLERTAKSDRTGNLLRIVRNNRLDAFLQH